MRIGLLSFCLLFSFGLLKAQAGYQPPFPYEIGLQIGTSQFLGDLGGQSEIGRPFIRDTDLKAIRPLIGAFGRWNIGPYFSARADLNYLQLAGDDALAGDGFSGETRSEDQAWYRYYRNLSFRSHVFEASIAGELIPYNFELGGGYQSYSVISPYGFIGVGIFHFNPQAQYDGQWVDLQPLSTEGQGLVDGRTPYSLTQFNVPLGFGVKWNYNDQWALSFEVNHRLTFTDYIDDVSVDYVDPQVFYDNFAPEQAALSAAMARRSVEIDPGLVNGYVSAPGEQRGDPKDNDSYYTIALRFSYFFDANSLGGGRRYGCPVW
ncbi:hypothetical protein SapgrDRAFT_0725 [Saprospira grandis DSM 2844]|uniref:Outer membrane protein beta-barrel domain-containing protein n=1 Tax=Saprospira grandis DSM 2844 TaxID=694433 RepID=J1I2E0_9BACT|nr:DUF6089 family protein [Saprospira grandis]EJF52468.1 hypothetical protein SapgrDRAFT_0725 [Saprospira grandis DSM 2844]